MPKFRRITCRPYCPPRACACCWRLHVAELDLCRHDAAEAGVSAGYRLQHLHGDSLALGSFWATAQFSSTTCSARCCSRTWSRVSTMPTCFSFARPGRRCAVLAAVVAGTTAERCRGNKFQPEPKQCRRRVFELCTPTRAGGVVDMVEPARRPRMAGALADNLRRAPAPGMRGVTSFTHGLLLLSAVVRW